MTMFILFIKLLDVHPDGLKSDVLELKSLEFDSKPNATQVTKAAIAVANALHKELGEPPEADSIFHHNTDPSIGLMDIGTHDY
jgi:hypothetical protein